MTETDESDTNHFMDRETVIDALVEYASENVAHFYNAICKVSNVTPLIAIVLCTFTCITATVILLN